MKKTRAQLKADAALLRKTAAEALVHADRLDREAEAMKDEPRELVAWWFAWARQVKRAH